MALRWNTLQVYYRSLIIWIRYYPDDIEMYQYDNGFKYEKKMNNWEHLQKFFKRKNIAVTV